MNEVNELFTKENVEKIYVPDIVKDDLLSIIEEKQILKEIEENIQKNQESRYSILENINYINDEFEISDEEINKWIQQGIEYFRENKDEYYYFTGSGNALVHIYRFDGDEEYYVVVSKDYESSDVEFEEEDYA